MIVESRSFIGDDFTRPTPEVFLDEATSFLLVVTPWGFRPEVKNFQQMITDYYLSASKDMDLTSPYPLLPHLSQPANHLRCAVMLAVEWLHSEVNREEYRCGMELFVATLSGNELLWIKYGSPSFIFCKQDYGLIPIAHDLAIPVQMALPQKPPLPTNPLGLHSNVDILVQGMKYQTGDKLLLISRQTFEPQIFKLTPKQWTIDEVSKILSQDSQEPFWTAFVTL